MSVQLYESKLERDETYRRRVTWCSENPDRAVVEYLGDFPAHVTNHKNSKSTGEYVRSNPKVIQKIKTEIETTKCKPKSIYTKLDNETDTERCKPRNLKQVQNCTASIDTDKRSTSCFSSKTNLADEMQQLCSNVTDDDFVQSVIFSKGHSPSVILYTDEQIADLQRCCGHATVDSVRSVLCVDRTFNLSTLFVTVTVFKNRTVIRKSSHEPPLFLGPMFLHGDGQQETYLQFFSHLSAKLNDVHSMELRSDSKIMTGSDEEKALVAALQCAFPNAKHLYCMLHCQDNVRHYLSDRGVAKEHRERIIGLLFGSEGAVLSGDESTLEARLAHVTQFVRMHNIDVCTYLTDRIFTKIRSNCTLMWQEKWLGKAAWSNNNAESVNHQLKLATDWKPQRLTVLVAHLRDAVGLQYSCLRRALFGQGDYQLAPLFHQQHYVPFVRWNGYTKSRQDQLFSAFLKDKGARSVPTTVTSSDGLLTVKGRNNIKRKPQQNKRPRAVRTGTKTK